MKKLRVFISYFAFFVLAVFNISCDGRYYAGTYICSGNKGATMSYRIEKVTLNADYTAKVKFEGNNRECSATWHAWTGDDIDIDVTDVCTFYLRDGRIYEDYSAINSKDLRHSVEVRKQ